MGQDRLRMGGGDAGGGRKTLIILLVAGLVVGAIISVFLLRGQGAQDEKKRGCEEDADCRPGSMCASGGCLILLSSESPVMWRDWISSQVDAGVDWSPLPSYGEKIAPTRGCPAKVGEVHEITPEIVIPKTSVFVYEVDADGIRQYQQRKVTGRQWLESMRFWFELPDLPAEKLCVSESVAAVRLFPEKRASVQGTGVDVQLGQAVTVGAVAAATLSCEMPLPDGDADEVRTLDLRLEAVTGAGDKARSVLAVPLGADVLSIEGPLPTHQRLLTGYVAYYWTHGETPTEISVRLRVPDYVTKPLDLNELNP